MALMPCRPRFRKQWSRIGYKVAFRLARSGARRHQRVQPGARIEPLERELLMTIRLEPRGQNLGEEGLAARRRHERELESEKGAPEDLIFLVQEAVQAALEERVRDGECGAEEIFDAALHLLGDDGRDHALSLSKNAHAAS